MDTSRPEYRDVPRLSKSFEMENLCRFDSRELVPNVDKVGAKFDVAFRPSKKAQKDLLFLFTSVDVLYFVVILLLVLWPCHMPHAAQEIARNNDAPEPVKIACDLTSLGEFAARAMS